MNKIYKVIWSKTRNCYVAVAEFVKRNGKGGSVLNRRHIAAALAATICAAPAGALANSGGSVDGAGNYIGDAPEYTIVIDSDVNGGVYGRRESGNATGASVTVTSGTVGNEFLWNSVYGGYSVNGNAENNTVTISGGMVGNMYGGYSSNSDVTKNTVILSRQGSEAAPDINGTLYGGYGGGAISNNTLQVEATDLSAPEIQNFDNYRFVLPDGSKKGDVLLSLNKQDADLTIDGRKVSVSMTGSTVADIGLKLDESVTLLEKTGGNGTFTVDNTYLAVHEKPLDDVAGGLPVDIYRVTASEDTLNVTYTEHYLYGDGGSNTPGQRETGNTLTITSGKATAGFGGRASSGDVMKNNVEMSGGELVYDTLYADIQGSLYGGLTDKGNANHNTVTVSGGKMKERVYGGASYDGNTENNTARISGGTVGTQVYGGRTYGGGNAVNNTVTIEGGTVGERVYGGRSDGGNAVNNTVTIEGGTVGKRVYGGRSDGGNAVNNTVTIEGGTVGERVYGGYASAAATGNAVNLTDTTHGLDGAKLYGYNDSAASHSGNELHIGGAKTYDENGTATITKGSWQGMDANGTHTNKVDTVANFDSIALHNVVWGDVPAISANEITNIDGLDVTGLEFFTHPNNSTVHEHAYKDYMVLVHADSNDLTGLKISYLDEGKVKTETLTNQGIHYHTAPHSSTENGVTVDGTEKKRIYLADHNKSVDFCFHVTGDKLTVGEVDFVKNGTARILDGRFDVRNAVIDADGLLFSEASWNKMHTGDTMTIVDAEDAVANKNGATLQPFTAKQLTKSFAESDAAKSITIEGLRTGTLAQDAAQTKLTYTVGTVDIDTIRLGAVSWNPNGTLLNAGGDVFHYGTVQAVDAAGFTVDYKNPLTVEATKTTTLLQANNTLQANALLANMAADEKTKTHSYQFVPADGVTVAARITGSLGTTPKGDGFTYTVNSNQADNLTFGSVDWKDSGALFTRPAAVSFAGAAVDTSKIHFKNVHGLDANKQMTLVSDFGNNVGKITGSKYYIGTTLEGEGRATLNGNDLVFTTHSSTNPDPEPTPDPTPLHAQEQTHNTVMGMTAGISLLASGGEQIGQALNSLSLQDSFGGMTGTGTAGTGGNTGSNTTGSNSSGQTGAESGSSDQQESNAETSGSIVASVGGGHMHQAAGSHVTSNSWNGVLGIGGKRAGKNGTLQYLAFAEHGRANFTLHSDAGRGDGTSKYVGGGLIGKWQNRRDVYVEASIRAGRMHDTASDMLYDEATGQSYGYDVHANYIGGHVGLGKVFYYDNGRNLDVYARYFHMKREGVSFEAGGHFDLDSVTSSVLRVGARYGATDKKWNWYGGLAYEYEFDGKSTGRADGAPIRAASMEGGSVRAEIGLRMEASKTSPWKADINLSGYAGKRRGISGNVAVAYTF